MKYRDILNELRANKTEFAALLNDASIKMGFECEMALPKADHDDYSYESRESANSIDPDNADWDELQHYIDNTSRIEDAHDKWLNAKIEEAWDEIEEIYVVRYCVDQDLIVSDDEADDLSDAEQEARSAIIDENREAAKDAWEQDEAVRLARQWDIDHYIHNEFSSIRSMMRSLRVNPEYGWNDDGDLMTEYQSEDEERDDDDGDKATHKQAAESIRRRLGVHVEVFEDYHESDKDLGTWYIEPDGSIKSDSDHVGAEIVSAVGTLGENLGKMKQLFDWMGYEQAETNSSTGLHVSISIGDLTEDDYDFFKMVLLFEENRTASLFRRLNNTYAAQMRMRLVPMLRRMCNIPSHQALDARSVMASNSLPQVLDTLKKLGRAMESEFDKYSSVLSRENGVFEFRSMGGQGYEMRYDDIRKQVVHMANILNIGSDPDLMVREYLTQVFLLLDTGKHEDPALGSGQAYSKLPYNMSAFSNLLTEYPHLVRLLGDSPPDALQFARSLAVLIKGNGWVMNRQQRLQLARFLKQEKVTPEQVRADLAVTGRRDEFYNKLGSQMGWPMGVRGPAEQGTLPFARQGNFDPQKEPAEEPPAHLPMRGDNASASSDQRSH